MKDYEGDVNMGKKPEEQIMYDTARGSISTLIVNGLSGLVRIGALDRDDAITLQKTLESMVRK